MILAFNPRFVDLIFKGSKIHTLRADPENRWKAGRKMHLATGVRTKNYRCFAELTCIRVQKIKITYKTGVRVGGEFPDVVVDGARLFWPLAKLAANDGFETVEDFLTWFDKDFSGKIIHWSDMQY